MQAHAGGGGEFDKNIVVVEFDRIVTGRGCFIAMLETCAESGVFKSLPT